MKKIGYLYAIVSAILFGSAGLFVKLGQTQLDSVSLLTVQYVIAVIIMFIILFFKDKKALKVNKTQLKDLAILGVVGNSFMTVFYYLSFNYLPVAMTTVLLMTYPIMVFFYAVIKGKEKLKGSKILIVIMAFLGCIISLNLVNAERNYSLMGIGFGLLAAVFYAFMNIFSERNLSQVTPLAINGYSTLFSLISLIIYKFPHFLFRGEVDLKAYGYITILAVFCEIIPLTLLYAGIKHIGSVKVSIISNLEIPTSIVLSYFLLNESISIIQLIGTIIVIYSVYLIKIKE